MRISDKVKATLVMCSCIYYCGSHKTFSILLPIISPQETSRRISQQQWSIASILPTLNLSLLLSQESRSYTWSCSAQQNCVSGSVAFNDGLFQDLGAGTPARMMALTLPYSNKGNNLYILTVSRWTEWTQWAEWSRLTPANVNSPWSVPLCKSWYSGSYFFLVNRSFPRTKDFIC